MKDGATAAKRRKWKRFRAKVPAVVLIHKPRLIEIGGPRLVELGPLVDISMGGLAVQYIADKKRQPDGSHIAVSINGNGLSIEPIPFKTIADKVVAVLPDERQIRSRSVQFGNLTTYQSFQLETFIAKHTTEAVRERREGQDRRRTNDPRFEDPSFRLQHERRFTADRRKTK